MGENYINNQSKPFSGDKRPERLEPCGTLFESPALVYGVRWKHWLRNSFIAGLVLVTPMVVTYIALRVLFGWLTGLIDPLVVGADLVQYTGNNEIVAQGLALVILFVTLVVIGYVAQLGIGSRLFGGVGRAVTFIPLVRVIYTSVRQMADSLVSQESRYESVVLVEYPREGIHSIGLVTAESPKPVQTATGPAYNVYFPNSPNPTNGHLAMVPKDQVREIDMSPRRGIRLMVTTGMAETSEDLEKLEAEIEADLDRLK